MSVTCFAACCNLQKLPPAARAGYFLLMGPRESNQREGPFPTNQSGKWVVARDFPTRHPGSIGKRRPSMAAALRVYGVARIAGSSCQGQQLTAAAKAIGRRPRTTKRCNQISGENKKVGNDESGPESAPLECDACHRGFGPFLWLLSLGQQRK